MVFNGKFTRIIITGLLTGLLTLTVAFASSADTKVELDNVKAQLESYQSIMNTAHSMAEDARALGEAEDGVIIKIAQDYWHSAFDNYNALYPTYTELNNQYTQELKQEQEAQQNSKGRYIGQAKITAYTPSPSENAGYSVTATGMPLAGNEWKIVAGDPSYWRYGTKFRISGLDNEVTMLDCGGAIKGSNRFDLLVPIGQANSWGIQYRDVWVIE